MQRLITLVAIISIAFTPVHSQNIRVNQIGYYPSAQKLATVPGNESGTFSVINKQNEQLAYSGSLSASQFWNASGESICFADFTSFTEEGEYYIKTDTHTSPVFEIKANSIYDDVTKWTAKGMYLWRASTAIETQHATFNGQSYARSAGHADNNVIIHSSAATPQRPAGTLVSAPKGWYDAGDYNLYVINAGVSVFHMAHAYELYPEYFASQNLDIPESSNNTPDILDEIKWELDWLLAMQDLDGGVYFKLTSKWFSSYVMPGNDDLERYMVGKSTTSALDFAAMTAMAYRLFKNSSDYPGFADKCLAASKKAWKWAKANPSVTFTNPSDIQTGAYSDTFFGDEFFWAAAELLISTGDQAYYNELNFSLDFLSPQWHYVAGNGIMSLALHIDNLPVFVNKNTITSEYTGLANSIYNLYAQSPYKIPFAEFNWGSNGDLAGKSAVLASAYKIVGDAKYKRASMEGLNYLLGRNAVGYCFVTGFGDKYPVDIHDRRSQSDGISESIPGYLVGGPNTEVQDDCGASSYPSSNKAKSYVDKDCSYSTNEIAINWNAPMLALLAMTAAENRSETTLTVEITSPVPNENFTVGKNIAIEATAATSSGTITKLSFYSDSTQIYTGNSAPYSYIWADAEPGEHIIKAVATDSNGKTAEDEIIIKINPTQTPYSGTPHQIPGTIQFEEYDKGGNGYAYYDTDKGTNVTPAPNYRTDEDVDIEICTDIGGGYNVGWTTEGEWLEYTVDVATTGKYTIVIRAASGTDGSTILLEIDNVAITENIEIQNTAGWQEWTDVQANNVSLEKGEHILRMSLGGTAACNLNHMIFSSAETKPIVTISAPEEGSEFNTSQTITLSANVSPGSADISDVAFYANSQLIGTSNSAPYSVNWSGMPEGTYTITATVTDNSGNSSSDEISVIISYEPNKINLQAGWNLIGYPFKESKELSAALSGIWDKVLVIKDMDSFYDESQPDYFNKLEILEWGKGYFLYVSEDCELVW